MIITIAGVDWFCANKTCPACGAELVYEKSNPSKLLCSGSNDNDNDIIHHSYSENILHNHGQKSFYIFNKEHFVSMLHLENEEMDGIDLKDLYNAYKKYSWLQ